MHAKFNHFTQSLPERTINNTRILNYLLAFLKWRGKHFLLLFLFSSILPNTDQIRQQTQPPLTCVFYLMDKTMLWCTFGPHKTLMRWKDEFTFLPRKYNFQSQRDVRAHQLYPPLFYKESPAQLSQRSQLVIGLIRLKPRPGVFLY